MSMAKELSELVGAPVERCEEAMSRCDGDRERATDYVLTHEDESETFWIPQALKKIDFERWGDKLVKVDEETLSVIMAESLGSGIPFTDSTFPPNDASLFFDPVSARTSWKCHDCNRDNPLPSDQVMDTYRRSHPSNEQVGELFQFIAKTNPALAIQLQSNPVMASRLLAQSFSSTVSVSPLTCQFCRGTFPLGLIDSRPVEWLRPVNIRDDVTAQYGSGAPWKLVRDSVRPDDVRQGAIGNCWFVGALAILARQKPMLIGKNLPYFQEFNECGAYLVRLCKDGLWRNVIVDDFLPCNRNKSLCYTTASRRQLWVPLIEKAAAKLSGGYEGMHSGTLCEAFSLLTGFATERELLTDDISADESDLLWARIVSGHSAGYLVGLACAQKPRSPQITQFRDKGLQAPHAYVVLDTAEVKGARLVQLGNPWGDRSPSTWKGAWGNQSIEFRSAVRDKLLPPPTNEVNSNGEFWMTWEDLLIHFATIEICRTADKDLVHEERLQGWLPAVTGLGDVFQFETRASTIGKIRVDISLYQESNIVRESARGAVSTNIDIGFVVIDSTNSIHHYHERKYLPEVSVEVFLDPNRKYTIVPLSFANGLLPEHRKVTIALRTTALDLVSSLIKTRASAEIIRRAFIGASKTVTPEEKELLPGVVLSTVKDGSGICIICENRTTCLSAEIMVDAEESSGLESSRGTLFCTDVIPPGQRSILLVLTHKRGGNGQYRFAVRYAAGISPTASRESHAPPLKESDDSPDFLDLHACVPMNRDELLRLDDLMRTNRDPKLFPLLVNLGMKKSEAISRLRTEYVSAGIDLEEANIIASEEAEFMYLP